MNFDAVKHLFKPMSPEEADRLVAERDRRRADGTTRHVDMSVGLEDVDLVQVARVAAARHQRQTDTDSIKNS